MKLCNANDVKFIRLQFCDIHGLVKNMSVPIGQLEKALDNKVMLDGSSIRGFRTIETSDMYFYPDVSTFRVLPWRPREGAVARIICDIYNPDGTPFDGCPRNILKRVLAQAESEGYKFNVGPECEFFLFDTDEEGFPTNKLIDQGGYYDVEPTDLGSDVRRTIINTIEELGFDVEASHHEVAPSQHEIDFKYADALTTADNVITFKWATKSVAHDYGLYATFMPKPISGVNGSGMHCNMSLSDLDGNNVFFDESKADGISDTMRHFIAGVLKHVRAFCAVSNPLVNSYKRLVPGYEAPVYLAWSQMNRSALIRIPATRGPGTRVELRCPDPSANPYLAFAVMLEAGLDGIRNKMEPPAEVDENIYELEMHTMEERDIHALPGNLDEALQHMEGSKLVEEALGSHCYKHYIETKYKEYQDYRTHVSTWELDHYLHAY
ncbi:MAG: type I glutamate--ammonia ligase [Candidatus Melainabacteria bacterium]|nr:type I glutamate--ammonia ligase [Candidatus Melainabacteria bacterium]